MSVGLFHQGIPDKNFVQYLPPEACGDPWDVFPVFLMLPSLRRRLFCRSENQLQCRCPGKYLHNWAVQRLKTRLPSEIGKNEWSSEQALLLLFLPANRYSPARRFTPLCFSFLALDPVRMNFIFSVSIRLWTSLSRMGSFWISSIITTPFLWVFSLAISAIRDGLAVNGKRTELFSRLIIASVPNSFRNSVVLPVLRGPKRKIDFF